MNEQMCAGTSEQDCHVCVSICVCVCVSAAWKITK